MSARCDRHSYRTCDNLSLAKLFMNTVLADGGMGCDERKE